MLSEPWYRLLVTPQQCDFLSKQSYSAWKISELRDWPHEDKLLRAIEHESRLLHDVDSMWRNIIALDPSRQDTLKEKGIDYELLLDLNEGIWRLLVRLFVSRDIEVKII
ncbi:hypothetical protein F4782DRAFT_524235 [Xylaria castorea]|nr:hypothetical protein F4782DRAFT_524235 [Xylaria castorea]